MLREEFDIVRLQTVMIPEGSKKLAAGQLIGKLVAAIGRSHLFENVVASERDVEPADPCQNGCRQKIFFGLAALQFLRGNADAFTESEKKRAVAQNRPRRTLEVLVADFGMNNVDEFLMDLGIVDAGQLATHQLRRIDRDVVGKYFLCFFCSNSNNHQQQLAIV